MKVTFSAPTQQDKAEYAFFASVLEGRTKVTATDEAGNSAWLFIKDEDLQRLGKEYVERHLSLSYSQVFNGYHLSLSQNDYYNDPERYPEKVIRVRFDGIEEGTGREVYRGLDTGRYYLREVSRREKFARWLVCGKRRHQDDGDEPRANLVFEFNGHRERVRYDDWNGVAAYSDTFNPEFSKAAVKRSGSSEDFSGA